MLANFRDRVPGVEPDKGAVAWMEEDQGLGISLSGRGMVSNVERVSRVR